MKKSQSVTLTVVAAMGMAARAQNPLPSATTPLSAQPQKSCEERRSAAKASGTTFTEVCKTGSAVHGAVHGGFGATGKDSAGG